MDDIDVSADGVRIKITGLGKTMRALSAAGAAAEDMRGLMHSIGMLVVRDAQVRAPKRSGQLASTLRAGKGKTKAVVRAGGARTPYAGPIHYGWPARNIDAQPFLVEAVNRQRAAAFHALDKGLGQLLKEHKLK